MTPEHESHAVRDESMVSSRRLKAMTYMEEQKRRTIQMLAVSMHEAVCGSWDAAGFEVREGFLLAGAAAYDALAAEGWDMFSFPDGGWALVT